MFKSKFSGICPVTHKTETILVDWEAINVCGSEETAYSKLSYECPLYPFESCDYVSRDSSCPLYTAASYSD